MSKQHFAATSRQCLVPEKFHTIKAVNLKSPDRTLPKIKGYI